MTGRLLRGVLCGLGILALCTSARIQAAVTAPAAPTVPHASRAWQEAAFLHTVDRRNSANVVTGDLVRFTGTHVAYVCDVDNVVTPGVILGQCGSVQEPMDLFIHLARRDVRVGDRLRILGIMETPTPWTDVNGHTVYYAFVKALFVHRLKTG